MTFYNKTIITDPAYYKHWLPEEQTLTVKEVNQPCNKLEIHIKHKESVNSLSQFRISDVDNCCGNLFLSAIYSHVYDVGNGKKALILAIRLAELGMYSSLECIIPKAPVEAPSWTKMKHLVERFGFKEIKEKEVYNNRSGNTLRYFQLKMKYPKNYMTFAQDKMNSSLFIPENWTESTKK